MNDTDTKQTWTYTVNSRANGLFGAVRTKTTETLDFDRREIESRTVGHIEGEYVNTVSRASIDPAVLPEAAARYRRANGYTRIR